MTGEAECEVCGGPGRYPIHNMHGTEVYTINCPECYGSGLSYAEPEPEPEDLPPKSAAATIQSRDDMLAYVAKHWSQ